MRIVRTAALLVLTAALTLAGCSGPMPTSPSAAVVLPPTIPVITHGKVAIISIDGLRPDAIPQAAAANILGLAARGAYSWHAQTILPSTTLPSHISMLTGYVPEEHRMTWDDYEPARGQIVVPTLFGVARARGLRTGMVVGKEKFSHFRDTGACDTFSLTLSGDAAVAARAAMAMSGNPDLLFVHFPEVDLTGHAHGWMSSQYLDAVRRADAAVGQIVSVLPADTTIIVTADHGGHLGGHGSDLPVDTTIPWVIAGPSTARGRNIPSSISTVDTAATAAFVLGVMLQPGAQGRPIYEAFVSKQQDSSGLTAQGSRVVGSGF